MQWKIGLKACKRHEARSLRNGNMAQCKANEAAAESAVWNIPRDEGRKSQRLGRSKQMSFPRGHDIYGREKRVSGDSASRLVKQHLLRHIRSNTLACYWFSIIRHHPSTATSRSRRGRGDFGYVPF